MALWPWCSLKTVVIPIKIKVIWNEYKFNLLAISDMTSVSLLYVPEIPMGNSDLRFIWLNQVKKISRAYLRYIEINYYIKANRLKFTKRFWIAKTRKREQLPGQIKKYISGFIPILAKILFSNFWERDSMKFPEILGIWILCWIYFAKNFRTLHLTWYW